MLIGDEEISDIQRKDLNRPRVYCRDLAMRYGVPCFATVTEAVQFICEQHVLAKERAAAMQAQAASATRKRGSNQDKGSTTPLSGFRSLVGSSPKMNASRKGLPSKGPPSPVASKHLSPGPLPPGAGRLPKLPRSKTLPPKRNTVEPLLSA
jgi:hypothetical protein